MCVSIPNAEGDLQPKCLCPDGYKKEEDGDCVPIGDTTVQDANGNLIPDAVPKVGPSYSLLSFIVRHVIK